MIYRIRINLVVSGLLPVVSKFIVLTFLVTSH